MLAKLRPQKLTGGVAPHRLAICVCAYNEQAVIAARVENLLAARRAMPDLDILFYVDAATDGTAGILQSYGDRIKLVVSPERHGKTYGMNRLVGMTEAEIVVFSDANVIFADDAIERLVKPFADPSVGCACGNLLYVDAETATSTAATGSLYWRLEEHIKSLESATGSVMGADGSIFALRRALHRPPPPHLIDDMFVSLSVLCGGARIVRVADAIAYEAAVSRPAEEFRRKIRIACQAFNVHRALWGELARLPPVNLYKYLSHKLLRWFSIFFLSAFCVFAVAAVSIASLVAGAGVMLVSAMLAVVVVRARAGVPGKVREILSALLATGIGVIRSLRGETFQTWNPPASARTPSAKLIGEAVQA